jgi:hypothetical protein
VKNRIRAAQVKATLAANAELIHLYWDIGRAIAAMQEKEGWGARVIPRLARDIASDMPAVKVSTIPCRFHLFAWRRHLADAASARQCQPPLASRGAANSAGWTNSQPDNRATSFAKLRT